MIVNKESPVAAVQRILTSQTGVMPSNILCMMLIDAVRETTPVPQEMTMGLLTKILQSLEPSQALDAWASRSSREIVKILSEHPAVKQAAEIINSEHVWDELEGVISGMLCRVCQGKDLESK